MEREILLPVSFRPKPEFVTGFSGRLFMGKGDQFKDVIFGQLLHQGVKLFEMCWHPNFGFPNSP